MPPTRNPRPTVVLIARLAALLVLLLALASDAKRAKGDGRSGQPQELKGPPEPRSDGPETTTGAREVTPSAGDSETNDLEAAASSLDTTVEPNTNSHRIVAAGWPSTSPMWPSIQTQEPPPAASSALKPFSWPEMIEPFIFADQPRSIDYSLLLSINQTVSSSLRAHQQPIAVILSFEFYFNLDSKVSALPGIKIEIDRKQFRYLEPSASLSISPKVWAKFNEQILVTDAQQFDNHDWLKFSLVNRQSPSLVAIRRLKVEFSLGRSPPDSPATGADPAVATPTGQQPPAAPTSPQQNEIPVAEVPQQQPSGPQQPLPPEQPQAAAIPGPQAPEAQQPAADLEQQPDGQPQAQATTPKKRKHGKPQPAQQQQVDQPEEMEAAGSQLEAQAVSAPTTDALTSTIKPVKPKASGSWIPTLTSMGASMIGNPFGRRRRRRKRQATSGRTAEYHPSPLSIVFTCYQRDSCEWRADGSEAIQWSSARMPPSTQGVQNGYYYASSLLGSHQAPEVAAGTEQVATPATSNNLLRLYLNQTEAARIRDQNSDHCVELALYITERAQLKLYRLTRSAAATSSVDDPHSWVKGNQILSWASTMISEVRRSSDGSNSNVSVVRQSLPKSRLAAMENGQDGWTFETICFGDYFASVRDCGLSNCAFGFEMQLDSESLVGQSPGKSSSSPEQQPQVASVVGLRTGDLSIPEQVIGISLRNEFSVKPKYGVKRPVKWLQTWQRLEVNPEENWRFFPKMDLTLSPDNVTLLNTYDGAHYHLQSDWLLVGEHLEFTGSLLLELNQTIIGGNSSTDSTSLINQPTELLTSSGETRAFALKLISKIVDHNFDIIHSSNSTIEWPLGDNATLTSFSLDMPVSEFVKSARQGHAEVTAGENSDEKSLFKIALEFIFEVKFANSGSVAQYIGNTNSLFKFHLANVSLSDRCYPSPCQFGSCHQNGTGLEDWECKCDDGKHRGRRCEFGRWCEIPHVTPWVSPQTNHQAPSQQPSSAAASQQAGAQTHQLIGTKRSLVAPKFALQSSQPQNQQVSSVRQPKLLENSGRISGSDYCQRKLGSGSKCTEIDLPLSDTLYTEDEKTFTCSCQDDYYLSDDSKCKQAHPCNSIVCPSIGMICDESKPFNRTQPCVCNEKQDWHLDSVALKETNQLKCTRRQCQDVKKDCGFEAHICLPTLPGERPICKCGPNFALKVDEKTGRKYCQSTACILPTLNDCEQICTPNNEDLSRPHRCDCHPGYQRDPDASNKCKALKPEPHCRPGCHADTQVCTDFGCRCKQGYIGEGEVIVKHPNKRPRSSSGSVPATSNTTTIDYVQSVRCLNVCSLSYAENKLEFEMIESVCPLGLCDPSTFQCKCNDPASSALVNAKYEPIYAPKLQSRAENSTTELATRQRVSPLCHLRRVCEPDSISYKICRSQGAICVPDYTKAAMFDCICPPSTEKKLYGQGSSSEFTCEPKCGSIKYECLRRQAVCRLVDQESVRCDCLPGHMFDVHDHKCYLAKFSYAINLILVNRYYEPESKFHQLESVGTNHTQNESAGGDRAKLYEPNLSDSTKQLQEPNLSEVVPQFQQRQPPPMRAKFIADYNQCNITQVIPKSIIEDPYEHDIESYLSYIDQCNEKIHQNVKTYHLNSKLAEDLRQSLRQHLRGFTVTTSNSTCSEVDQSGMYLNCTVYLQSNDPIPAETVEFVFNNCDKNGQDDRYCWIKPRLLLKKSAPSTQQQQQVAAADMQQPAGDSSAQRQPLALKHQQLNFRQVVPCEIDNFCGPDAFSVRLDEHSSLCSCKCPLDIEVVDVKDLERKLRHSDEESSGKHLQLDYHTLAAKEICAPRNHCASSGSNSSTFCLGRPGSVCHYDVRLGSRCQCVYPSYENDEGKCVEVAFSKLDDTLIVLIIMLGTGLIVSIAVNLFALAKSQKLFSQSKQYPLSEFPTTNSSQIHHRSERLNRSTGVPNLGFDND